jgi:crotonobetainyl-CoA:carnitine CoA-transferase CaiB-like acyl-CoA transferase
VKPIWEQAFEKLSNEEVVTLIHEFRGDAVPFNNYPSLFAHPQLDELDIVKEVGQPAGGSFRTIGPVWHFADTPAEIHSPPPALGQHTDEILTAIGLSAGDLQQLREAGVIN